MTLSLLRIALNGESEFSAFEGASEADWKSSARLCVAQGVLSIAWDGVVALPKDLQPSKPILIKWALSAEKQEKRFASQVAALKSLQEFYAPHGISVVLLKGIGLALNYPVPEHRESGDLDVYALSADSSQTNAQARKKATKVIMDKGIAVDNPYVGKHSEFAWEGVSVENHRLFVEEASAELQALMASVLNPAPARYGDTEFLAPSKEFQCLFTACHAAHHYCAGIVLRHLCDWACLVKKDGLCVPEGTPAGLREWISTLSALCNEHLGCNFMVEVPTPHAAEVFQDMLYPKFSYTLVPKGNVLLYKYRRAAYRSRQSRWIFGESFIGRILRSIQFHLHNPHQILNRAQR